MTKGIVVGEDPDMGYSSSAVGFLHGAATMC
jgi:hypothetical protein